MDIGARPVTILLVEDNPDDVILTREAMKEGKIRNTMFDVSNGVDAMMFLRKEGGYKDMPRPDIILLDLNLPKKDGKQVLEEIKADAALQTIPVVILTTSEAEEDVIKTYMLHANCYITKPVNLERFIYVVKSLEEFWLDIVRLPKS
jgi:DNA-binding response OmpR family regulator